MKEIKGGDIPERWEERQTGAFAFLPLCPHGRFVIYKRQTLASRDSNLGTRVLTLAPSHSRTSAHQHWDEEEYAPETIVEIPR